MARIAFGWVNVRTDEDSHGYAYSGSPDITIPRFRAQFTIEEARHLLNDLTNALCAAEEIEQSRKGIRYRIVPADGPAHAETWESRSTAVRVAWSRNIAAYEIQEVTEEVNEAMSEKKLTERERQVWDICMATTSHKFDERDCVRLVNETTGRNLPVPEDGEDYDLLAGLTDAEIAKIHMVVSSWENEEWNGKYFHK